MSDLAPEAGVSEPPPPPSDAGLSPGTLVGGRFRVEKRLAAGGMGIVYRATQEPLGRPVALKVLRKPQDPRQDAAYADRFLREAAVVANLTHPNTVVVHDYGQDGPLLYFAMEFVDGATLSGHIRKKGPLSPKETVHVCKQIASSLKDAHAAGLVHRDLKPGNVMLLARGGDPLFTKVLDFGLVKMTTATEEQKKLTQSGILMGSPRYMAPEQVRGTTVDLRTDVYSFGALMCFMLTGKSPFDAGSQFEAMRAHVYTPAPGLAEISPECQASPGLEDVVARCLQKAPEERYQSMDELLAALNLLDHEARVSAPMIGPPQSDEGSRSGVTEFVAKAIVNPGKSKVAWAVRVAIMLGVVGLGIALALLIPRGDEPSATPLTPDPSLAAAQAQQAAPPEATEPTEATEPSEATELAGPSDPQEPVAAAQARTITVNASPSTSTIRRQSDGVLLGVGSVPLRLTAGTEWTLEIAAEGYEPRELVVSDDSADAIELELVRRPASRGMRAETDESAMTDTPPSMVSMQSTMQQSGEPTGMVVSPSLQNRTIQDPWDQ